VLFAGLAMSLMVAEPVAAGYIAGPEVAFTGHLYYQQWNLNYCGVAHSQVGDEGSRVWGWAFTRPALFFGACNTATSAISLTSWLGGQVTMTANGSICGQTTYVRNDRPTAIFGFGATPCDNPPGWQEWRTYGGHVITNAATWRDWYGSTASPWALY
jgi:hypothetical protein